MVFERPKLVHSSGGRGKAPVGENKNKNNSAYTCRGLITISRGVNGGSAEL